MYLGEAVPKQKLLYIQVERERGETYIYIYMHI